VNFLRETGHNPDDILSNEQKQLLISADYYDRLNLATAYFPSQNAGQNFTMQEGGAVTFGMQGGAEVPEQQNMEGNQIVEEDEENDGEVEGEEIEADQDQVDAYNQLTQA